MAVNAELRRKMEDQAWRLNNLYYITDKDGKKVRFKMNWAQEELFYDLWYNNLILKARQLGMSTFIGVLQLDTCLFNENTACGTIAHDRESAEELFRRNIKYPYDHLPEALKTALPPDTDRSKQLVFPNNSSIRVATSLRSGTMQVLHISEFGKICAKYPDKAREIVTGSLETVGRGNLVFIESTAEGREGYFHDYCQEAQAKQQAEKRLTDQDYRFFFYPWWKHPDYRITDKNAVRETVITGEQKRYFDEVESKIGEPIPLSRRIWWIKKFEKLGEDMFREYPATPEEAFHQSIEGAYYATQMAFLRKKKRITKVPHEPMLPVNTFWDLGMDDSMTIWFHQRYGMENRLIDYYEASGEGMSHYAAVLQQKANKRGFIYGTHYMPHDANVRELSANGKSRKEVAQGLGIRPVNVVKRPRNTSEVLDQIEATRNFLMSCWVDEEHCSQGIKAVEHYRKEWDEKYGAYKQTPRHDWASHGADSLRTGAVGFTGDIQVEQDSLVPEPVNDY